MTDTITAMKAAVRYLEFSFPAYGKQAAECKDVLDNLRAAIEAAEKQEALNAVLDTSKELGGYEAEKVEPVIWRIDAHDSYWFQDHPDATLESIPLYPNPPADAKDAARLGWLERVMFEGSWGGTIGEPKAWRMAGPYRHELAKMHGNTLREAIDAAMENGE